MELKLRDEVSERIKRDYEYVCSLSAFNKEERLTIVRALNEMEVGNG